MSVVTDAISTTFLNNASNSEYFKYREKFPNDKNV